MRSTDEVHRVFRLAADGLTQAEIAAATGIGQTTVGRWLRAGPEAVASSPMRRRGDSTACPERCPARLRAPPAAYAYLLGQYLGDGSVVHTRRGVYRLFVSCCAAYPGIVAETAAAIGAVLPSNAVGRRSRPGVTELSCYSRHWPCLLPQHGPGRKHERPIVLEPWQRRIALDAHADLFVRGLIHSDGYRGVNHVRGAGGQRYGYVRYSFSNRSDDIRALFVAACDRLGVQSRRMNRFNVSVARRRSVELLEQIVGPTS